MPRHALHRSVDQARRDDRGRADTRPVGAKLGAFLCGLLRTAMNADGLESPSFRPLWTLLDRHGNGLDIYGSEG